MEDPLLPKNYRGEQRSGCRRVLTIVGFLFLSLAFLYMLVISILSPVLWVNYNSSIAQNSLDASSISFDSLTLRDPTENTLTVDSNVTISQAGKFAATLKSSTVNVLYQGQIFGRMTLPERELKGDNEPTSFTQTSTLTIVNAAVFQQASSKLLQGSNVRWRLSGDVTLSVKMGFSLDFALRLEKDVELFGTKLQDVRAYNLKVVQGLEDRLIVTQTQHVLNPSNIAMENMGDLTLEVYVPQIDATQTKSLKRFGSSSPLDGLVKISEVYIPNFKAPRGEIIIKNTTAAAIKSSNNIKALENFLSSWNLGKEQPVKLVGPIATSTNSSFLLNILEIDAVIEGNKHTKIIQGARFGDDESNNPVQTAYNPLDLPVTQSNFNFAVFLTAPFFPNYEGISPAFQLPLAQPPYNCVAKPSFGNLTLEGTSVTIPSKGFLNITVTVNPIYQQRCDSFRIWAACCGLYTGTFDTPDGSNPKKNITNRAFQIGTRGTMTTKIGNFSFTQLFQQDAFNMTCGTDTDFFNNICYNGGLSTFCLQSDYQYCDSLISH